VTAALRHLLEETLPTDVSGASVTTRRPDTPGSSQPNVYIFLYRVVPSAAWRNADAPTRDSHGNMAQRPFAALDLYYLFSFHGDERKLEPQRLLGSVTRTLHERPILTPALIESTIGEPGWSDLAGSDLAQSVERVKITPEELSLEDLTKLWSGFFQAPYLLSVAYTASVVLIEGRATPRPSLPVRERHIHLETGLGPWIDAVTAETGADAPITISSRLVMCGRGLAGVSQIRIGPVTGAPMTVSDTRVIVDLASFRGQSSSALRPGVVGLQAIRAVDVGASSANHDGLASNVAPFVLRPEALSAAVIKKSKQHPPLVRVRIAPAASHDQRVALLLSPAGGGASRSYYLPRRDPDLPPPSGGSDEMTFSVLDVAPGSYLVRVEVDGAHSVLAVEQNPNNPKYGQYIGPVVTIP
jgi:hypothetical protein